MAGGMRRRSDRQSLAERIHGDAPPSTAPPASPSRAPAAPVNLQPEAPLLAAEMYVRAMDVPLIQRGRQVRLQFDGFAHRRLRLVA